MPRIPTLALLVVGACSPRPVAVTRPPVVESPGPIFIAEPAQDGLVVRLSAADPPGGGGEASVVALSEPLPEARVAALLAALPPLDGGDGDGVEFELRPGSKPPPRPGGDVAVAWPPPPGEDVPDAPAPPLAVLRFGPEGAVPLAPNLSVTFSQPMVALTGQDEAAKTVPVTLLPQPPGQWRWLGTKTLLFEPDPRFPMATEYRATVPAGTRSARGDALASRVDFTFRTPPVAVTEAMPAWGVLPLRPTFVLGFDQAIDATAMLPSLRLSAGGADRPIELVDALAITDRATRELWDRLPPSRRLALRPLADLPYDAPVLLQVAAGAPSAEGPRRTEKSWRLELRTHGPLTVLGIECGWNGRCRPEDPLTVHLSNPLQQDAFDPAAFSVDPQPTGLQIAAWGDSVSIGGRKRARATTTVTVPASLTDTFGQTLGKDVTLSVAVGPAESVFFGPGRDHLVLDPVGRPSISAFTVNQKSVKLRVFEAGPGQWDPYRKWLQRRWERNAPNEPSLRALATATVPVPFVADELVETVIDLSPYLRDGLGQLVVALEPGAPIRDRGDETAWIWVQRTRIGLTAAVDSLTLLGWATALDDGAPLADVELAIEPKGPKASTDSRGLAELVLDANPSGPQLLIARRGGDVAILPQVAGWWSDYAGWRRAEAGRTTQIYATNDRGLYRPGETVHVQGFVRAIDHRLRGDVEGASAGRLAWQAQDPVGNALGGGAADISGNGAFHFEILLPPDVNLGDAHVSISVGGASSGSSWLPIRIAEFRRPEFETTLTLSDGPQVLGGSAIGTAAASYFSGGPLAGAPVRFAARWSEGSYAPPGWDRFQFGRFRPWWRWYGDDFGPSGSADFEAISDALGEARVRMDFVSLRPAFPQAVTLSSAVEDVNRQTFSASSSFVLHPGEAYVGLRAARPFVREGETIEIDAAVVGIDGGALDLEAEILAERLEWVQRRGSFSEEPQESQTCRARGAGGAPCRFVAKQGGTWRIVGTVRDGAGRPTRTELTVWVSGGAGRPERDVEHEELVLVPSGKDPEPGSTLEVLVLPPWSDAEGLAILARSGRTDTIRFAAGVGGHVLQIPIDDAMIPGFDLQVECVGKTARPGADGTPHPSLPPRPSFASASLTVRVPPVSRRLAVAAIPRDAELSPGGRTTLDLTVLDAAGKPVADAQVLVGVVDEAVLALTGHRWPDPIDLFYAARAGGLAMHHARELVKLAAPVSLAPEPPTGGAMRSEATGGAMPPPAPGAKSARTRASAARENASGEFDTMSVMEEAPAMADDDGGDDAGGVKAIAMRADFSALALLAPDVRTDGAGRASVELPLPDSLTRYRVFAVAADRGNRFGGAEATVTARLPLQVRPSPPRFLNFGDRFEWPVVLHNPTAATVTADVAVRATNLRVLGPVGRRVVLPPASRAEVRFAASAERAGLARLQAVAATAPGVSPASGDAWSGSIPVYAPATTEAFATYGTFTDEVVAQPLRAPPDAVPQYGGLEITATTTALATVEDAVLYLQSYPFECSEQLASRILSVAALQDVMAAFGSREMPAALAIAAQMRADLDKLRLRQNGNGGFGLWRAGGEEYPWATVHVAHAIALARSKGYGPDAAMEERVRAWLRSVRSHIPPWYSRESKDTIVAYALMVRERMGDPDPAAARALLRDPGIEKLPLESLGLLLPTLAKAKETGDVDAIVRHLLNRVAETAAAAHFADSYTDGDHVLMHSDRRADAVLLDALTQVRPDLDLLPKLLDGLLGGRTKGRWESTQENVWVLLAIDRWFRTKEAVTPDLVVRAWLGDGIAFEEAFRGRDTAHRTAEVPMRELTGKGDLPIVLAREGKGRIYYRLGLRYAPSSLRLDPADRGFGVTRSYEAVDDPGDVSKDDGGVWHVRPGARVRVVLRMVAPSVRHHVALVDPLPAGFEPQQPGLLGTEAIPVDKPADGDAPRRFWWGPWWNHENLRDDRVEAFASTVWDGVYTYRYVARATTPGEFVVPPARAEEMYHPETFGRSGTERVIVGP